MRLPALTYAFLVLVALTMLLSEMVTGLDAQGAVGVVAALLVDAAGWLALLALVVGGRLLGPPGFHRYMPWLLGAGAAWTLCCSVALPSWMPWLVALPFVGLVVSFPLLVLGEVCPWDSLARDARTGVLAGQGEVSTPTTATRADPEPSRATAAPVPADATVPPSSPAPDGVTSSEARPRPHVRVRDVPTPPDDPSGIEEADRGRLRLAGGDRW